VNQERNPSEIYWSIILTLLGIVEATVFTFTAQKFLSYINAAYPSLDVAVLSHGFWLNPIVWNYAAAVFLVIIVLVEYSYYIGIVARIAKVRDMAILMVLGFFQTWLALSPENPAQFWFVNIWFCVFGIAAYANTTTFPQFDEPNEKRNAFLITHLRRQSFIVFLALCYSLALFWGLREGVVGEVESLVGSAFYVIVFGGAMVRSTAMFIDAWSRKAFG
jgi:hypothetical protein